MPFQNSLWLMEGENDESAIRNALTNTDSPPPYGGVIDVPDLGGAASCSIDVLDLGQTTALAQIATLVRGHNQQSSIINVKSGGYIKVVNSLVQFHNIRFLGAAGAKAAVVLCRRQANGAESMNRCEFINCDFSGTFDVAAIVAYGAEQLVISNCSIENSKANSGSDTSAALSLDSADLAAFSLSADYTGHTNSGIFIENTFIFHRGGAGGIALKIGDTTTDLVMRGGYLGASSGQATIQFNGYATAYSRARYPQRILLERPIFEQSPDPTFKIEFTGTATPDEVSLGGAGVPVISYFN